MGKRGPQSQAGKREKNGRLSRKPVDIMAKLNRKLDKDKREAMRPAVEARVRQFGYDPQTALDQMAGSFVGRLCMAEKITAQQHEAARMYLHDYRAMTFAVSGPQQSGAVNMDAKRGLGVENVDATVKAMAAWDAVIKAVQARQNELRGTGALIAALDHCVLRDGDFPHMLDWLRQGLDALAAHYQIGDRPDRRQRHKHPALTE